MAMKTAVRRASKNWPKTQRLAMGFESEQAALEERQIDLGFEIDEIETADKGFQLSDLAEETEDAVVVPDM